MDKFEKLVNSIMKEAEQDGEPVTREEAEEMAKMEMNANENCKRYEKADVPRKKAERTHKPDDDKRCLMGCLHNFIENYEGRTNVLNFKPETEIEFEYNGNCYSLKLIKHRPPKA